MHILISILIGLGISLSNFSKAQANTCISMTHQLGQILTNDDLSNPVSTFSGDTIEITAHSEWEPRSSSYIIRKGLHSRTYTFRDTSDGCVLEKIDLSFQPSGKFYIEKDSLSKAECAALVEAYDKEQDRREESILHSNIYMSLLDSTTEGYGRICSQVNEALQTMI